MRKNIAARIATNIPLCTTGNIWLYETAQCILTWANNPTLSPALLSININSLHTSENAMYA